MHWAPFKGFFRAFARKAVKLSDSQVSAHTTYTCVHARGPKVFDELMKVGFTTILAWANLDLFGSLMNNFFCGFPWILYLYLYIFFSIFTEKIIWALKILSYGKKKQCMNEWTWKVNTKGRWKTRIDGAFSRTGIKMFILQSLIIYFIVNC